VPRSFTSWPTWKVTSGTWATQAPPTRMSNRPQPALDRAAPACDDAGLARNSLALRLQPRTVCGGVVRAGARQEAGAW
jgi:hypothetical protein